MKEKNNEILKQIINEIVEKYKKEIENNNFTNLFKSIIKEYEKFLKQKKANKEEYNEFFLLLVFNISITLNKEQFKEYITQLKKYKIYKYKTNKVKRIVLYLFPKIYIYKYYISFNNFYPFSTKIKGIKRFKNKKTIYYLKTLLYKKNIKYLFPKYLIMDYTELVITTKCTLKCKNCANLISKYDKPYDVDEKTVEQSIKNYFQVVDYVSLFRILGGEPFCNKKLKKYLKLLDYKKIGKTEIVTNGTLVPKDEELYKIIKKNNVVVSISNYGKYSFKLKELCEKLDKESVKYKIKDIDEYWYDYGDVINYNKSKKELRKQYRYCDNNCKSILNGEMYYCPRYSHGYDLKLLNRNSNEYVDLINSDKKTIKKKIRKMIMSNKPLEVCNYCLYGTDKCKKIKPAIQIRKTK